MTRNTRKRLLVASGLALLIAILLSAAFLLPLFSQAQIRSTSILFSLRESQPARATVIVGINERSYRELLPRYGTMGNWPRTLYAQALLRLRQAGARVVVFDIFLDAAKPEDAEVARAIRKAGNVIMPVEAQGPREFEPSPGVSQAFDVFVRPAQTVSQAAAAEGTVNITTDSDSVVRSIPLLLTAGHQTVPALPLTAVARFIRRPTVLDAPPTRTEVYGAGRAIPIEEPGRMLINFLGPPSSSAHEGPITIVPFVDVLNNTFAPAVVRDKIALVGLTIRGLDEVSTPTTANVRMWGVEVLGHAIETILNQRYLVPVPSRITIGLIVALSLMTALLVALVRPLAAGVGVAGLLLLYFLAAVVLFNQGTVLNLIYPPGATLLTFAVMLSYRVIFEQAEQRMIRSVMARYLSPAVSQWALKDPERLKLGGETRTMTVLFSDIRGFTTLSHTLNPQVMVSLLNEYMTAMTDVIFRHDGVLDKYIGDAIMAFWNAPMEQPDHTRQACMTALDMISKLRELQADWERRGVPRLELGIGINTGPMVVGNMGARARLAYTVLGDAVNVASRLEGLTKVYGTRVVVGEATRAAAGEAFIYRFLDLVAVKGRSEPLAVYEVISRAGELDPGRAEMLNAYERGIELYRARRWKEAAELFSEMLARGPGDGPCALYLRRSAEFLESPPPADWDWVFVAQAK